MDAYFDFALGARLRDIQELLTVTRQFIRSQQGRTKSLDDFRRRLRHSRISGQPRRGSGVHDLRVLDAQAPGPSRGGRDEDAVTAGARAMALASTLSSHDDRDIHVYYALALASAPMPKGAEEAEGRRKS